MDRETLIAALEFSRARLLGTLDAIEKSGADMNKVLAWRPGPGRAHIGWQAMHCAATHDRYLNVRIKGGTPKDESVVANFAGGSTPADDKVPGIGEIRAKLESSYGDLKAYASGASNEDLNRVVPMPTGPQRSVAESLLLMAWHEGHHQGQIHLTWNLYKAAHGMK